jgi:hypothetical protein
MLKFELQAILFIVSTVAWGAWLVFHNLLSKARERGLIDKAKKHATSFSFWQSVFAVIGIISVLFFVMNLFSSPS